MASILNGEEVLCSVNSYKDIRNSNKIVNFFANFLGGGLAGGVINDFKLLLTPENLYIQAIEHAVWGGLSEVVYTDKFSIADITFEVMNDEGKEFITITTIDDEKIILIRDNENKSDLALMMSMLIKESKVIKS